ncbi:MAG: bifunctional MaoC family dehydratase N-terminal/OB-fold nucleic acid binding domain-containing protein [Acidimicrobiales bacterium]
MPPTAPALDEQLEQFDGRAVGLPSQAPDPVNQPMIRHWVEAMGDENPVYVDEEAARANGFAGVIAPATMLQAWIMRGYKGWDDAKTGAESEPGRSGLDELFALLDEAGFTSVVATNCDQEYARPLLLGDRLTVSSVIASVSPEKHTALGDGHFVTTRMDFADQRGGLVATMRFRLLRFRPRQQATSRPRRPRPAVTKDIAFFFEGAAAGKLLVQRCGSCGVLRHPPCPSCPDCRSLEWDVVESTGRGTVYSYVVVHHPQVPAFDYPLPIAVVEMEEGTRLVADLVGVDPGEVHIGMPVEVEMVSVDDELTLPMFRPSAARTPI